MKKIILLCCIIGSTFSAIAQQPTTGIVSDYFGPLAWANVAIKNSNKGTVTNEQGTFSIDTSIGDTLAISYVGYTTKELVITSHAKIDVILEGEALDEVLLIASPTTRVICSMNCSSLHVFRCSVTGITIENEETRNTQPKDFPILYPNPSPNGYFNLRLPNTYAKVELSVTNISGQQLLKTVYQNINQEIRMDLSRYPTGIYLINIIADGQRLPVQKAVIR